MEHPPFRLNYTTIYYHFQLFSIFVLTLLTKIKEENQEEESYQILIHLKQQKSLTFKA